MWTVVSPFAFLNEFQEQNLTGAGIVAMDHYSEDFTPIIASGIEYSGVSTYRAPSPLTPARRLNPASSHSFSQEKVSVTPTRNSATGGKKTMTPENWRMLSPRVFMSQSKSVPCNCGTLLETSTPCPWRSLTGGVPVAPAKYRLADLSEASTPRQVRSRGGGSGTPMSAEYRLSNGYSRVWEADSSPSAATKSAPVRHLSFPRFSRKQVLVDVRRLRQLAVYTRFYNLQAKLRPRLMSSWRAELGVSGISPQRQGLWKLLIERVKDAQRRGLLASPDQEIAYGTYHLLALMKLQDFRAAAQEIAAFGNLDAPHYRFENHPELYPGKSGSMVPFALRCMHTELPHLVGKTADTLYRLYNLLAHCDSQIVALQAELATECTLRCEEDTELLYPDLAILERLLATWQQRREAVCFSTVGYHLHQQQFIVALKWLNKLMANSPSDPHVKSKVALIQAQLGDIVGAQRTFADVEALVSSSPDPDMRILLAHNRGILYVALGKFPEAIAEFDAVLAENRNDIVSTNNKALSLLYNQQLVEATDVLEDAIFRGSKLMLNEAVIANACSLYEVVSFSGAAAKRSLRTWMKKQGPDDFEPTSFRL